MTQLKSLAKHCDWAKKMPSSKATLAKKLFDTMEEETPKRFLAECDSGLLKEILEGLEVDSKNYARKEYASAIITTAETIGLENCFSSFPVTKLKEFVKACQLKVDSDSMEILLQALMEQVSIIAPYEVEGETPSKEKPELDKNIRIVDLWHHFYREDLANWLEDRKLISHGNKKELIERVHRALNDKLYEKGDKKQDRKKSKGAEKEATTTTTTSGEESSKNKTPKERKSSTSKSEKKRKHHRDSESEEERSGPKSSKTSKKSEKK
jgi:hypothetical protein